MKFPLLAFAASLFPLTAHAQDSYLDNRSTPSAVVESLYSAINARQYLRAYSYFAPEAVADYESFKAGYQNTDSVTLRLGKPMAEGTAGTTYTHIPTVIRAVESDGTEQVYAGCYRVAAISPSAQDTPPFVPIRIAEGTLAPTDEAFESASGDCSN